ncbi:hypothetical protein B0H63DRAFT_467818 [Podospora didyma]|uniref:NAD(P)-binding protein n=1 Tax=Podospora didyma TaxID=330526 RepID=A0AAE0NS01_9PEZI|nr:hypothetical protein B0H63DRAFT_467818 [Podospora didyma]
MGSLSPQQDNSKTLLVLGAGPGIGRSVTSLFASRGRYANVVLIARRAAQLAIEKKYLQSAAVGHNIRVETYDVDLADTAALSAALDNAEAALGGTKPEAIFFNAARVLPSAFFSHPVEDIEYDLKICVSALYNISARYMAHLVGLAQAEADTTTSRSRPALIVTSSALPHHPIPQLFALSLVKAAQRNLVHSLHLTYADQGVHVGVINVGGGPVSPVHETWNPSNIADRAWEWFDGAARSGKPSFEVEI